MSGIRLLILCSIISCTNSDFFYAQVLDSNLKVSEETYTGINNYSVSEWTNTDADSLGLKELLANIVTDQQCGLMTASHIQLVADINSGSDHEVVIPANTTIDGGGTNAFGENGKSIETNTPQGKYLFVVTGENVTFINLKLKGPWDSDSTNSDYTLSSGIYFDTLANNGQILFCEISGFPGAAISFRSINNTVSGNNIHDNYMLIGDQTMGYGVFVCDGGSVVVHDNYFDNNQHAIAGGGKNSYGLEASYEAYRNNVKDSGGKMRSHHFDMHGNSDDCYAGNIINIHDNVFYYPYSSEHWYPSAVIIRGINQTSATVQNNVFINDPDINSAVRQVLENPQCTDFASMNVRDNVCNGYPGNPYTTVPWVPDN